MGVGSVNFEELDTLGKQSDWLNLATPVGGSVWTFDGEISPKDQREIQQNLALPHTTLPVQYSARLRKVRTYSNARFPSRIQLQIFRT